MSSAASLTLPMDGVHTLPMNAPTLARQRFAGFILTHGRDFPVVRQEVTGPTGECWTNAWNVATTRPGRRYVEGFAIVRGRAIAHGWTIDPFGIAYEHTTGFEHATAYRGFVFDISEGSEARRMSDFIFSVAEPRVSLIEGTLSATHVDYEAVVRNFGA